MPLKSVIDLDPGSSYTLTENTTLLRVLLSCSAATSGAIGLGSSTHNKTIAQVYGPDTGSGQVVLVELGLPLSKGQIIANGGDTGAYLYFGS